MSRLDDLFTHARQDGRGLLMPFVVAGYPGLDATEMLLNGLKDAGADIAEVGFPFSDPIADGPVIAGAMHEALCRGVTVDAVFGAAARVRARTDLGLIAMVSESIVHRRGGERFVRQAVDAGFDGFIIPDIDLHAADALLPVIDELDVSLALLVAPTTTAPRLAEILQRCRGMVYLLARAGVTGARAALPDLAPRVAEIRRHSDVPIAVGFGISTPEQVRSATEQCDAAIAGSAIVDRMRDDEDAAAAGLAVVETLATGL
ncbi:MAG: tryptophan synthase subunit alpha [Phycisphaerales bacterium]|jgi:tryptophan synthase alpha chain|nr:tryptophan synthase subunit alpha [Phycisphaerales bacterium]